MGWFNFNESGGCLGYSNLPRGTGISWENDGSVPWPGTKLSNITATIEGGVVTGVDVAVTPIIYAHVSFSGGDGKTPPGVEAGNAASKLTVGVKLSQSPTDPDAGLPGGVMFGGVYRITIRNNGDIYTVQRISIANNEWNGFFCGKHGPGVLYLSQGDMEDVTVDGVGTVKVVLVGQLEMKVFEEADTE